jgi:hypothetical protein
VSEADLEGEVLAEEDAEPGDEQRLRAVERYRGAAAPILRGDVRTAAVAAAGGVIAGAATVAAVRAVGSLTSARRSPRRFPRRREQPSKVVASRSFLVDVHLLGR